MRFPKLSALALAATLAFPAFAGSVFTGFAITSTGTDNTFYDTDTPTALADWTAGLASIMQGSSLWLGGEVSTFPSPAGITNNSLGTNDRYDFVNLVYTIDGVNPTSLGLALNSSSGNNDKWQTLATAPGAEVGSGLSVGSHTINVRFEAFDVNGHSGTVMLDNVNHVGWDTTVTVVPEPASGALILAGLGMIGVMAKRRRVVG